MFMIKQRLVHVAMPVALVCSLFAASSALAVIQRTFVKSAGSSNRVQPSYRPCRTFVAAVSQTAVGGEVIVLDSAGYGPVTLTQSVSIISPTGVYAGISVPVGQSGVTINSSSAVVVLRGLTINGQGGDFGIWIKAATRVHVESCVVSRMGANGLELFAGFGRSRSFCQGFDLPRQRELRNLYLYQREHHARPRARRAQRLQRNRRRFVNVGDFDDREQCRRR